MKSPRRILIVGGVAGGASAAARARRVDETAEILVFERGPHISFASCGLPYFLSGEVLDRDALIARTPDDFWNRARVRVHTRTEAVAIDRARRVLRVQGPDGTEREERYDKLILSQGARPIVPPLPGADLPHVFTLRDIPDAECIAAFLEARKPARAVVIGAGFIGLEMAETFLHRGLAVTVVERLPQVLPVLDPDMAALLAERIGDRLVLRTGATAARITPDAVELADGECIPAQLVLLSVGVKAEVELARAAGLEIGQTGGVKVNGRLQTSDADIYAVGDAAEVTHVVTGARVRIALGGPANRQGRLAGANAAGQHHVYRGALGSAIVRVLDVNVGCTGLNRAQAAAAGLSCFTSVTRGFDRSRYFPGAAPLVIKLIAEEGTGRLLGAQVLGGPGVDKRLDVLATAITAGMTVFDLETLDLAYAPPFSAANDPVNVAGFVAAHAALGDAPSVSPDTWRPGGELLLDVRDPDELAAGRLVGAVNIPLGVLRERAGELPRDRAIVTYCQQGQRGHLAACTLRGLGFANVANLRGGFALARRHELPVASA